MSDKVVQMFTEGSRLTVLTEQGHIYQGQRTEKDSNTGTQLIGWHAVQMPPGCDSRVAETDHTGILEAIAAEVIAAGPHSALGTKASARIWELVKDFKVE